jgi:septal ring factor EnvC (AmiA/AmiB activator)
VTNIQKFCSSIVLVISFALPAMALDGEQFATAHNHDDLTAMQSELQLLEANVNLLTDRLASLESQRTSTAEYTLRGSSKTADLGQAIEQLLKEVNEQ